MKRRAVVGGLAALAAGGLSACKPRTEQVAGGGGGVRASAKHLRRHMEETPRTLDPALNTDVPSMNLLDDLFEGLMRLDPAGNSVPAVATRWSQSDDGTVWTFELRRDARWSNGDPVTAHDFVYAWRRLADPATQSQMVQSAGSIYNALAIASGEAKVETLGVKALGDYGLEVRLVSRTPWFPYLTTNNFLAPVHRATIEKHGAGWTRPGNLVGNGVFFLASERIDGPIRLERNPHHPDAQSIRLESVTHFPVADRSAVTARYLANDLDITNGFQITDYQWLRERLQLGEVSLSPYFGTVMLGFHPTREPFDNRALREALNMAIDRDVLTGKLLRGLFLPAYNIVPPVPGYTPAIPEWANWPAERRHARARELYAEAGYSRDRPLRVELPFSAGDPDIRRTMEGLSAMWRTVLGADVQLAAEEFRVLLNNRVVGKHRMFWYAWIGDYPDPLTFLELRRRSSGQNYGAHYDARYEELLDRAIRTPDDAERARLYAEAETLLNDSAVNLPIYFYQARHLIKPWVRGFAANPMDRHPSRDLWLDLAEGAG